MSRVHCVGLAFFLVESGGRLFGLRVDRASSSAVMRPVKRHGPWTPCPAVVSHAPVDDVHHIAWAPKAGVRLVPNLRAMLAGGERQQLIQLAAPEGEAASRVGNS